MKKKKEDKTVDFQSREYGSRQVTMAECDLTHKPRYFDEKLEWGSSSHNMMTPRPAL